MDKKSNSFVLNGTAISEALNAWGKIISKNYNASQIWENLSQNAQAILLGVMREKGYTQTKIAERLGISQSSVNRLLKKTNLNEVKNLHEFNINFTENLTKWAIKEDEEKTEKETTELELQEINKLKLQELKNWLD